MARMVRLLLVVILSVISLPGCGRKGPILPPIKKIPEPVIQLTVSQAGWDLNLNWRNPTSYIDGNPLPETTEVELWMFSAPDPSDPAGQKIASKTDNKSAALVETAADPEKSKTEAAPPAKKEDTKKEETPLVTQKADYPPREDFENRGELLKVFQNQYADPSGVEPALPREFTHTLESPADLTEGYAFALRVKSGKKTSAFSDVVTIEPEAVSVPPPSLKISMEKDRIVLIWEAPKSNIDGSSPVVLNGYNIYREELKGDLETPAVEEAVPEGTEETASRDAVRINSSIWTQPVYEDAKFEWDQRYRYTVRTVFMEEASRFESGDSSPVEITAIDVFPPSAPKGLVTVAGGGIVSVSWEAVTDPDVAGYRIWRKSSEDEDFVLLTEAPLGGNSFSDENVKTNGVYLYAVTAVDRAGNESLRSAPVEVRIRVPELFISPDKDFL
ncbi:MAG: hypothetical protein KKB53_01980 [Acidobacteria bacterium]|nr:hypothetical protein [Acidobacteriota bacterium]